MGKRNRCRRHIPSIRPRGSVCRIVTVPPDAASRPDRAKHVRAFVTAMDRLEPLLLATAPIRTCRKRRRSIVPRARRRGHVVLDTRQSIWRGDTVVQRATNHVEQRFDSAAVVAISSHDARA